MQRRICLLNDSCQGPGDKGPGSQASDWLLGSGHIQGLTLIHILVGARVICCPARSLFASIHKKRQALILCCVADTRLVFCPLSHTLTLCLMDVTRPAKGPDCPHCSNKTLCVSLRVRACVCVHDTVAHRATSLPNCC